MPVKSIPIVLNDGKTRQLRFEWEALENLEKELNLSIFELGPEIMVGKLGFTKTAAAIWAGLSSGEDKLELDDVRKLLDSSKIIIYLEAIGDALNSVFPEEKGKKATRPGPKEIIPGKST